MELYTVSVKSGNDGIITHLLNEIEVRIRFSDGWFRANDICEAGGVKWNDYWRSTATQEFVNILIAENPAIRICESMRGRYGGTWIHPKLAYHLAESVSPRFFKWVADRLHELEVETGEVTEAMVDAGLPIVRVPANEIQAYCDEMEGRLGGKLDDLRDFIVKQPIPFTDAVKKRVFARNIKTNAGKCLCCCKPTQDARGDPTRGAQVHHVNGREAIFWNGVVLCGECHVKAHNDPTRAILDEIKNKIAPEYFRRVKCEMEEEKRVSDWGSARMSDFAKNVQKATENYRPSQSKLSFD